MGSEMCIRDRICMVLQHEGFRLGSWRAWLSQLHEWAFRYQMPLLRCDMSLWGCEDYDFDGFYRLSALWEWNNDPRLRYPLHPVVWRIVDNLFTSSSTAIRAILEPDCVIATMNPWPSESVDELVEESFEWVAVEPQPELSESNEFNRLCFDGSVWNVFSVFDCDQKGFGHLKGFEQMAYCLASPNRHIQYGELLSIRIDPFHEERSKQMELESQSTSSEGFHWDHVDNIVDEEYEQQTRQAVIRLSREIERKNDSGLDSTEEQRQLEDIENIRRKDLGFGRISRKYNTNPERHRTAVSTTMHRAIKRIKELLPELGSYLNEHLCASNGGWEYRPSENAPKWVIVNKSS